MMKCTIIGSMAPPVPDHLAWYKFDLGTVSDITATIGPDLVATYAFGGMADGTLYNGFTYPYIGYATYPLELAGVTDIVILGLAGETSGGLLFNSSAGIQRLLIEADGSITFRKSDYTDVTVIPAGTVKFDGTKVDVSIALPEAFDMATFGPIIGGGGVWRGSMDELIIDGTAPIVSNSFDDSFDLSFG